MAQARGGNHRQPAPTRIESRDKNASQIWTVHPPDVFSFSAGVVCKNGLAEGALARAAHQEEAERWRDKWCVPSTCACVNPACSRVLPARACSTDVARPRQSEVEETMKKLGSYPGFMGYVIINADGIPIRRSVPPPVPPLAACGPFGECAPQRAVIPAATAGEHLSALHTLFRCFVTAPCCARPLLACSPSQLPGPPRCSAVRGAAVDVVPKVARGSARARPVQRRDVPASAIT